MDRICLSEINFWIFYCSVRIVQYFASIQMNIGHVLTIISLFFCPAWGSFFKRNGNYKMARIIKPFPRIEKSKFLMQKWALYKKITYLLQNCLCNKHNVWEMLSDVSPEFLSKPVSSSHFSTMKALGSRLIVEPSLPIYMNNWILRMISWMGRKKSNVNFNNLWKLM